jgi:hypothetical protein
LDLNSWKTNGLKKYKKKLLNWMKLEELEEKLKQAKKELNHNQ